MLLPKVIEWGLLFLLIYTPWAFGGVTEYSFVVIETVAGGLLFVWLCDLIAQRRDPRPGVRLPPKGRYSLRIAKIPGMSAIVLFCALITVSVIPLPVAVIMRLSPRAHDLYAEAAALVQAAVPARLPLSVCSQATETEIYKLLAYVAVFFLIINTIRTPRQIRRMVFTIMGIGLLEALFGLMQLFSGEQLPVFYPDVWAHGSFVNKNHFAGYLEMVILVAFGVLFTRFEAPRNASLHILAPPEEKYAKASVLLSILFILICALLLSGSRGGVVSVCVGLIVFVVLVNRRQLLRRWIVIVLIFLPMVIGLTVLLAPGLLSQHAHRFWGNEFESGIQVRWEIWKTSGRIFLDFPLIGSGLGTFPNLTRRYQTFRWEYQLVHSESDIMQLIAETGVIGTLMVTLIGGTFFYRTLAQWRKRHSRWAVAMVAGGLSALVSLTVHGGVDFNLHIPSNALLFSVIAALTYVTAFTHEHRRHGKK